MHAPNKLDRGRSADHGDDAWWERIHPETYDVMESTEKVPKQSDMNNLYFAEGERLVFVRAQTEHVGYYALRQRNIFGIGSTKVHIKVHKGKVHFQISYNP